MLLFVLLFHIFFVKKKIQSLKINLISKENVSAGENLL